jgi:hypothetical protein
VRAGDPVRAARVDGQRRAVDHRRVRLARPR